MIEPSCGIQIILSLSIKGEAERAPNTSPRGRTRYKMLQRCLLLLSSLTLALALGNGRGQYYMQQNFGQQKISQNHISSGFDSSQASNGAPSPYSFSYEAQADGGHSSRQESADSSGNVAGSYSLTHEDGSKRLVKYEADSQGFRAVIDTDELGTKSDNPARVTINSAAPSIDATKYTSYQAKAYSSKASQPTQYSIGGGAVQNGKPSPYSFSYASQLEDGSSFHSESSDGSGKVSGSYGLSQKDGRKRTVDYSADAAGFVAAVQTNEFGTKSENPAHVSFMSSAVQEGAAQSSAASGQHYSSWGQQSQSQATQGRFGASQEDKPFPYSFSYDNKWKDGGNARSESSDGSGKVVGSYSLFNTDGRRRTVDYSAGAQGFTASVQTNEHGTKGDSPADVKFLSSAVLDAPQNLQATSYASSIGTKQASTYTSQSQGQYQQPIQYNFGTAPEGKPFPYSFNYDGQLEDGSNSRSESSDGSGKVTGSYSLSHKDGRRRNVEYSADAGGFRASVQTNEFGTKSDSPADVKFISSAPLDAPQSSRPSFSSYAPASPQRPSASYTPLAQSSYQPTQYSIGTAAEGKPFPYSFNYDSKWDDGGSARSEASDGSGKVTGSYSLFNADGRRRTVDYSADTAGFKASVQTNEFGTKSDSPADVQFYSSAPADAPASKKASLYSSVSNGQRSSLSYGQQTQVQQQFQPIQFSMGSAPDGKPSPYSFSYLSQLDDGSNSHKEASDGSGKVTGSYSLSHKDGRQRTVDYSADTGGFKASVQTNEFGTKSDSPADVRFISSASADFSGASRGSLGYSGSKSSSQSAQFYGSSAAFQSQNQQAASANVQPSPYQFGYSAEANGGASSRKEASDSSGKVTGTYSVTNEDGSMRLVEYIADQQGFHAKVKTNEPGTKSDNPADVTLESAAPVSHPSQFQSHSSAAKFPARTYTPKSSMISQVTQDKIW